MLVPLNSQNDDDHTFISISVSLEGKHFEICIDRPRKSLEQGCEVTQVYSRPIGLFDSREIQAENSFQAIQLSFVYLRIGLMDLNLNDENGLPLGINSLLPEYLPYGLGEEFYEEASLMLKELVDSKQFELTKKRQAYEKRLQSKDETDKS